MTSRRPYLTDTETRCIRHTAAGDTLKDVAAHTGLPFDTARGHVRDARLKLGGRNVVHAVALAMHLGYVTAEHLHTPTAEEPTP